MESDKVFDTVEIKFLKTFLSVLHNIDTSGKTTRAYIQGISEALGLLGSCIS